MQAIRGTTPTIRSSIQRRNYFVTKSIMNKSITNIPPQTQDQQPGVETEMHPAPIYDDENYKGSGKLKGKNALITGGDSGIGRAVAVAFAKEGANVAIAYLDEQEDIDADKTVELIEGYGGKALKIRIDISEEEHCEQLIDEVVNEFGSLNILVNNAGKQFPQDDIFAISADQLRETFRHEFLRPVLFNESGIASYDEWRHHHQHFFRYSI